MGTSSFSISYQQKLPFTNFLEFKKQYGLNKNPTFIKSIKLKNIRESFWYMKNSIDFLRNTNWLRDLELKIF
jgi:hypothetical protein